MFLQNKRFVQDELFHRKTLNFNIFWECENF